MQTEPYKVNIRDDAREWVPRPTLSGDDYRSLETYNEELEKIWWGDWVVVGRAEEIPEPGDYMTRDVAGESIFITRNEDRELRAFYNVCSHRGTKFLDDDSHGNVRKAFKCPYHAWTYDLNGELVGSPNVSEDEFFDRSQYPLHRIAVDSYAGFVFVNMTRDEPRPLMEALNDGAESITVFERFKMEEMAVGVRIVYNVKANWKIIVENFNECLHCPQVHPELVQVVPLFRFGEVWDESIRDDGTAMFEGATSFTKTGESELPKFPDLLPEDYQNYYGTFSFPNLMINIHPDSVMYYIGFPKGPNETLVVSEYLFRPETIADPALFKPEPVVELWDLISRQDWEVVERAQTGVGSRSFTTGTYPRQDRFVYWFNEEWRHKMGRQLQG
ncbi:MAG: glycine betaine catabolism [Actinomycetota bacterium]|jgi:Rieske 2Fe-2S family protein|nr:glycine betaine catabolism [Actinomycetota bacterium]MEA2579378.1 glycine betaine catabolism [Actinomycetota bacterium]